MIDVLEAELAMIVTVRVPDLSLEFNLEMNLDLMYFVALHSGTSMQLIIAEGASDLLPVEHYLENPRMRQMSGMRMFVLVIMQSVESR